LFFAFAVPLLLATSPAAEDQQPPLRVPSNVAWTASTIAFASSGEAFRGSVLSRRCERCHGTEGFSPSAAIPNLAGIDKLASWKQLEDFRDGKRVSAVMQTVAALLSRQDGADLAAYYAMLPQTADPSDTRAFPQPLTKQDHAGVAARLISQGDVDRGIPPCQDCHGPIASVRGAPSLITQNRAYILNELENFAGGSRGNDINVRMREISRLLTEEERRALADYYGAGYGLFPVGAGTAKQ
jgi:cytochrome c553